MKGDATPLLKFLSGYDKRFIIPAYQRNYDWKKEQCKQLFDDLVRLIKQKRATHFFGSVVSTYQASGSNTEYLIIDGQQRLTTVSLLLLSMYNLLEEGKVVSEKRSLKTQIYEEFLIDKYQPEEKRIKLKPVKNDNTAFGKLFDSPEDFILNSNLTVNYQYFYDRISQKNELTIDELFNAVQKLHIINIVLEQDDDPQLIFESLNSTGLDLSEGDKIRNFILMGLSVKDQEKYYNKYWNVVEENTNYNVSAFVRDYLSVKLHDIPSEKRVYLKFKEYVGGRTLEVGALLEDLLAYSKRYRILLVGGTQNNSFNEVVDRLNRLETTVTRPFFLEVLRLKDEGKLSMDEVTEIFLTIESYIFRRAVCGLPTNTLNNRFATLYQEIYNYEKSDDDFLARFKRAVVNRKETGRFPDDEEFAKAFEERQFYYMTSKHKIHALERLENFDTKETHDVFAHVDAGEYTIEHIMPQSLTSEWQRALGSDCEAIHAEWLHRIANLTLTAYNSKYSNLSFDKKKTVEHGFIDSGLRMNKFVAAQEKWTLAELEARNDSLKEKALKIWSYPETDYIPPEKQLDVFTLDDDPNQLTGRQITKFNFQGAVQPVESWTSLYQLILQYLFEEDPTILRNRAQQTGAEKYVSHFSTSENAFDYYYKVADGVYAFLGFPTAGKMTVLKDLFKDYDLDPTELQFFLRDETTDSENDAAERARLHLKFWTYAQDFIKKAHQGEKCFAKRKPTKDNWFDSAIGVRGCWISCIVNYNTARVELVLGSSQKEKNKETFDYLCEHKDTIEKTLGVQLVWDRNDAHKRSKIYYELPDFSVKNEAEWDQAATFLADWRRKFYDQFVPILKSR